MSKVRSFITSRITRLPKTNVWATFTPLATQHNAVNLGQAIPEVPIPTFIREAISEAMEGDVLKHQYSRTAGLPRLCESLSKAFSPNFNREIDPDSEVIVTNGATGGLFAIFQAFIQEGDEVILLDPYYDAYPTNCVKAGGTPIHVPLIPGISGKSHSASSWTLDVEKLHEAITSKTKMIVLNTPQNVPGKVWSRQELQVLADVANKYDLIVIADEVYDRVLFDGVQHVSIAALPGMFERTLTLGSAGKTFNVTGWKLGWIVGDKHLLAPLLVVNSHTSFCMPTPLQHALAITFEKAEQHNYFSDLRAMWQQKRDKSMKIISESTGLPAITPQGAYFFLSDISSVDPDLIGCSSSSGETKDWVYCKWLTSNYGVTCLPLTAFSNSTHAENYVRWAFVKPDEAVEEAGRRLSRITNP